MLDHFFPLLFLKDSESLKIFDIQFREVGAKRPLSDTSKVNRHTDTRTHGHTDPQTDGHFDLQKASAQRANALKKKKTHGSERKVELNFCDENYLKSFEKFPSRGIHLCFRGQCQFKSTGAVTIVPSHTKILDLFQFGQKRQKEKL